MDILRLVVLINNYESNLYREIKIKSIFKPKNREELKNAVDIWYNNNYTNVEPYGDISLWDTSSVIDMLEIFYNKIALYKCDISNWDVSKVTTMNRIFGGTNINSDISLWDTSNVTDMYGMFKYVRKLNIDISLWDTSSVIDMGSMFEGVRKLNIDISLWNTSSVSYMDKMFNYSGFNTDISNWNINNVKNMSWMFANSKFNNNLSSWILNPDDVLIFGMFDKCKIKYEYSPMAVGKDV